jgi:hypothetical protein
MVTTTRPDMTRTVYQQFLCHDVATGTTLNTLGIVMSFGIFLKLLYCATLLTGQTGQTVHIAPLVCRHCGSGLSHPSRHEIDGRSCDH